MHEGLLSDMRDAAVANLTLLEQAQATGLDRYVRSAQYDAARVAMTPAAASTAADRHASSGSSGTDAAGAAYGHMDGKRLADAVEALVGAQALLAAGAARLMHAGLPLDASGSTMEPGPVPQGMRAGAGGVTSHRQQQEAQKSLAVLAALAGAAVQQLGRSSTPPQQDAVGTAGGGVSGGCSSAPCNAEQQVALRLCILLGLLQPPGGVKAAVSPTGTAAEGPSGHSSAAHAHAASLPTTASSPHPGAVPKHARRHSGSDESLVLAVERVLGYSFTDRLLPLIALTHVTRPAGPRGVSTAASAASPLPHLCTLPLSTHTHSTAAGLGAQAAASSTHTLSRSATPAGSAARARGPPSAPPAAAAAAAGAPAFGMAHYQVLELLGDAVLGCVVSRWCIWCGRAHMHACVHVRCRNHTEPCMVSWLGMNKHGPSHLFTCWTVLAASTSNTRQLL